MDASPDGNLTTYQWYEIWKKVYLQPSKETFEDLMADRLILAKPSVKQTRAVVWAAITGAIAAFLIVITSFAAGSGGDVENLLCCSPFLGSILGLMILLVGSVFFHTSAHWFAGEGEWYDFIYGFSMIVAPALLVMGLLIAMAQLSAGVSPYLTPFFLMLSLAWLGYPLGLVVMVFQAVEGLSLVNALVAIFLDMFVVDFLIFLASALLFKLYPYHDWVFDFGTTLLRIIFLGLPFVVMRKQK